MDWEELAATRRSVREYLDTLGEAAWGGASATRPKFVSTSDPAAQWTGAHKGHAFFAYATNYLIDLDEISQDHSDLAAGFRIVVGYAGASLEGVMASIETKGRGTYEERVATCRCGRVQAVCVGDPVRVSVCHCLDCQRRSGSTSPLKRAGRRRKSH